MEMKLHQPTSSAESWKTLATHGCKPWVTNLSIAPHTLGIQTTNISYCSIVPEYVNEPLVNTCDTCIVLCSAQFPKQKQEQFKK